MKSFQGPSSIIGASGIIADLVLDNVVRARGTLQKSSSPCTRVQNRQILLGKLILPGKDYRTEVRVCWTRLGESLVPTWRPGKTLPCSRRYSNGHNKGRCLNDCALWTWNHKMERLLLLLL